MEKNGTVSTQVHGIETTASSFFLRQEMEVLSFFSRIKKMILLHVCVEFDENPTLELI